MELVLLLVVGILAIVLLAYQFFKASKGSGCTACDQSCNSQCYKNCL